MAFLPLYALGFMGMTRRLSQDINPEFYLSYWRCGRRYWCDCDGCCVSVCSVLREKFVTVTKPRTPPGDPQGMTYLLNVATFTTAVLQLCKTAYGRWELMRSGIKSKVVSSDPTRKKNTNVSTCQRTHRTGIYVSAWSLVFGFRNDLVHLRPAAASLVGIVVTCIQHSYNDDVDYYVEVEEIKATGSAWRAQPCGSGKTVGGGWEQRWRW